MPGGCVQNKNHSHCPARPHAENEDGDEEEHDSES
jgi:hypothetical protein